MAKEKFTVTDVSEKEQKIIEEKDKLLRFARQLRDRINADLSVRQSLISKFDPVKANTYLNDPQTHEAQLRQMSDYFYAINAQYRMVVNHYVNMVIMDSYDLQVKGSIDDYDPAKVRKKYFETSQYLDNMNLGHEGKKIMRSLMKEDYFFGYEYEERDSYFIRKINPDYCRITSISDGCYNFAFDFSYFDKFKDELDLYPAEFKRKYQEYLDEGRKNNWRELNEDKTICLKVNEDIPYGLPPLSAMFEAIFDLDEYKRLKKAKTKIDNFMLLVQEIPMGTDSNEIDNFLIDLQLANEFHENTSTALPDGVGLTTTPRPITGIKLQNSNNNLTRDSVAEAVRDLYSDSGVNSQIFNSEKTSTVGISKSLMKDEQMMFTIYRQFERWLNRKLKKRPGAIKFKVNLIDVTYFSKEEEFKRTLEAVQYGIPNIMRLGAVQGISPNQMYNKAVLENNILGLHDILKPLSSSHTQPADGGSSEGGRPQASDQEVSEQTDAWRESNDSRND